MPEAFDNIEKAAGMLICLGVDRAAQVLAHLSQEEVQMLAAQMAHTGRITRDMRLDLMAELQQRYVDVSKDIPMGDLTFVQQLLSETFGEERAMLVLEQLVQTNSAKPFRSLRRVDAHRLLDIISSEHPSIIALVLYYLPREKAAQVMAGLPDVIRKDVIMRMVNLQTPVPHMVSRLEHLLAQKLSDTRSDDEDGELDTGTVTGARALVEILSKADPAVEQDVHAFLQECDPALAEEVRKSMFVFEDIVKLDSRALQLVLREMSAQDIALMLKGTADDFRNAIFACVSENTVKMVKDEIELMGAVRVSKVEEAKQKAIAVARQLAEEDKINLRPSEEEELLV